MPAVSRWSAVRFRIDFSVNGIRFEAVQAV